MVSERNSKIDIIRGIAIIFVIIGHGIDLLIQKNIMPENLGWKIFDIIYMFHMPLFFLIAGYVYKKNNEKIIHIITKNVITCYIPYLFLNYLYWLERALASNLFGIQLTKEIASLSWQEIFRLSWSGDGLTWFLLSFLLVKTIFSILNKVTSDRIPVICFSVIFWMAFFIPQSRLLNYLWWGIFYVLGYMIHKYDLDKIENRTLVFVLYVNILIFGIVRYAEGNFDILVKLLIGTSVFCIYLLYAQYVPDIKLFMLCGKHSMVIYMVHGLSQFFSFYIISQIFHMQNYFVILFLMLVLQLLFSCVIVQLQAKIKCLQLIFYPYKYIAKKIHFL